MLTPADWAILAVVAASALLSLKRGFINEAASLAAWVCAFIVTSKFYDKLALKLTFFNDEFVRVGAAIALLFIVTLLIAGMCGNILRSLVASAGLTGTDRLLGAGFGIARGLLIVCAVLGLLQILFKLSILDFIPHQPYWTDSVFIPELMRIVSWFFVYVGTPIGE